MRAPLVVVLSLVPTLAACGFGAAAVVGMSRPGRVSPPASPSSVQAVAESPQSARVTWRDNSNDETGFLVEWRTAGAPAWTGGAMLDGAVTAQVVVGLAPATTYEFRVSAVNSGGRASSEVASTTTPTQIRIDSLIPDSATIGSNSGVTLLGQGFSVARPGSSFEVFFGGELALQSPIVDDNRILVTPPQGSAGDTAITVANGYETVSVPAAFTFFDPAMRLATNDLRVNVSPVGFSGSSDPETCASGRLVYTAWVDQRAGQSADIYFNYSTDGAATWSTNEIRLDTDMVGAATSNDVELACDQRVVCAVWQETRNGSVDVYCNCSTDNGVTWLANDVRLDTDSGSAFSVDPEVAVSGDHVYVTWWDFRNGHWDVYFNRSLDGGVTWLAEDVRINEETANVLAGDPEIRADGMEVYIAWIDGRNGHNDVYFNRSMDGGSTWMANATRLDATDPGSDSANVEFCVSGSRIVATWFDVRSGVADIYVCRSIDGGVTWSPDVRIDSSVGGNLWSADPEICCAGDLVHVAWRDDASAPPGPGQELPNGFVMCSSSVDGGQLWSAPRRVDHAASPVKVLGVVAGCAADRLVVAWADTRNGNRDVFVNDSADAGGTWRPVDLRADTDAPGVSTSRAPQLAVDGARVYLTWLDERFGTSLVGIFSNRRLP